MNIRRFFRCIPALIALLSFPSRAWSQTAIPDLPLDRDGTAAEAIADAETGEALPRKFREISLGMGLEELKTALREDRLFNFREDRDVSFLPTREQSLIESAGFSFIRRAFFQLREGQLFIMAFTLDTRLVDHYSVYTSLVEKYGEPNTLSPQQAVWESGAIRLALERPLTVKYIDLAVFNDIIAESATNASRELIQREEFLNDF
jgi:hypothetical protein